MAEELRLVLGLAVFLALVATAAGLPDVQAWWKEFKARRPWRVGR